MKVVFLDFDGVINNEKCWSVNWARPYEDGVLTIPHSAECIERLNRLVRETEAVVVISSSWRNFARWQDLYPALQKIGFTGHVVGETPQLYNDLPWLEKNIWAKDHYERIERGDEIEAFIDRHMNPFSWMNKDQSCDVCGMHPTLGGCPGHIIEQFAVLDDCSDMRNVKPFLVWTDPEIGLDDPDVERAKYLMAQSRDFIITKAKAAVCYGP